MAIKIGFGDRNIQFVFGAKDEVSGSLRNMKATAEDTIRGLESAGRKMEEAIDSLASFVGGASEKISDGGNNMFTAEGIEKYVNLLGGLKAAVEDILTNTRQGMSGIANELDILGGRARSAQGRTKELADAMKDVSKAKNLVQDAMAFTGVSVGLGTMITTAKTISETVDTMAIRMKDLGVTGDDLRKVLADVADNTQGYTGDILGLMDESEKAGIRNLDVMGKLITDVERLAQFGDVERTPLIQMLGQMHTSLGQNADELHRVMQAANELRKMGFGTGSLNETFGFMGQLNSSFQGVRRMREEYGPQLGLRPEDAGRDLQRTQAMSAGLFRQYTAMGADPSAIRNLLELPQNEAEQSPAVSTLMAMGGISYQDYSKAIMTGNMSQIMDALQNVVKTVSQNPDLRRYGENAGLMQMGLTQLFGSDSKNAIARWASMIGGPNDPARQAQQAQNKIENALNTPEDLILRDQQEFMKSTAGQWREFRATMERVLRRVSDIFDVSNPPMKKIYDGLNGLANFLDRFTAEKLDESTFGVSNKAWLGMGALGLGGLMTGRAGFAAMRGLARWTIGPKATSWIGNKVSGAAGSIGGYLKNLVGRGAQVSPYMDEATWLASVPEEELLQNQGRMFSRAAGGAAEGAMASGGKATTSMMTGARGALGRLARVLGKVAPWLVGGLEAYNVYQDTGSVGKAVGGGIGAGVGSTAGAALGGAIGQAVIPIPGLGWLVGAAAGGWAGGKLGSSLGQWGAGFLGASDANAAGPPSPSEIDPVARTFATEFVRELDIAGYYTKVADAIIGALRDRENGGGQSETWAERIARQQREREAKGGRVGPTPMPVPRPTTRPGDLPSAAPRPTPRPPLPADFVGPQQPAPESTPKPPEKGFFESAADAIKGMLSGDDKAAATQPESTPASPQPGSGRAPEPAATPGTPTPGQVRAAVPSPEVAPALGERVIPPPAPLEPVPTPSPVAYQPQAASSVNVNQGEVVRAVNALGESIGREFGRLGRADMIRRARNPLARAADALEV